jgi:hypothetical protein
MLSVTGVIIWVRKRKARLQQRERLAAQKTPAREGPVAELR